ncbi:MAG: hypothetical protein ABUS51_05470, partial [Acidobacteriota bacterium]
MRALGWLGEWLEATANAPDGPVVRFSSLFPFLGKTRLVAPPKSAWPPALAGKLYLQGAKLVPLEIVKSGIVDEARWTVDGESECLVPLGSGAPFRVSMRAAAAVDRLTGVAEPHRIACLEFAPNAGWWGVFSVSDPVWEGRVKSALRLLADSGFGGERSRGWGRAAAPQFSEASHLFAPAGMENCWWLLSLYSPHGDDAVDWSRSDYTTAVRGGWTDSPAGTGAKKQVRMMDEGSVLAADSLRGRAVDVAPDGFPHPVYRAGFALAMPAPREILLRAPDVRQALPPVGQSEAPAPATPPDAEPVPESLAELAVAESSAESTDAAPPDAELAVAEPSAESADAVPLDAEPAVAEPSAEFADAAQPDAEPAVAEPSAESADAAQPDAEPAVAEPSAESTDATQPDAEPAVAEPSAESADAVPPDAEPAVAESSAESADAPAPEPVPESPAESADAEPSAESTDAAQAEPEPPVPHKPDEVAE